MCKAHNAPTKTNTKSTTQIQCRCCHIVQYIPHTLHNSLIFSSFKTIRISNQSKTQLQIFN